MPTRAYFLLDDANISKEDPYQEVRELHQQNHDAIEENEQIELEGSQIYQSTEHRLMFHNSAHHDPNWDQQAGERIDLEQMVSKHYSLSVCVFELR